MAATAEPRLDIRLADLSNLAADLQRADEQHTLLAPSEREWPDGPPDFKRWRRLARIALRVCLAQWGSRGGCDEELVIDEAGKPRLPGGSPHFSISHHGELALLAICTVGPVGIDLERERIVQLSERRKALIEAAGQGLARDQIAPDFLSAWTRLEAFGKARGTGVGPLLTELGITAAGSREASEAEVAARAASIAAGAALQVESLALPAGCYGAIAAPREALALGARVGELTAADCDPRRSISAT